MRIIVGITGASGAVYGVELLRALASLGHEVHCTVSAYGWKVLRHECSLAEKDIRPLVAALYPAEDITAPIASGSFRADGMAIAPCSMKTLAAIANGFADNLLCRAADVVLKERANLVLAVRETPLSPIHLENMLKLSRIGVGIAPACPAFYHHPASIDALVAAYVGRLLDCLGVANDLAPRWAGDAGAKGL
ncbi:putative aromatic acid decarboxylase [uncultured delta proteobacterium]|uniref:Flavin prenyltransferase UbiX n=1 Tax=uncultured delta proteobacterium TaxID=34034 RepID=A0A212JIH0_9DELT|nr:putative aromatic acid decarboxylase [uncultured delta proteobacterium]